MQGRREGGGKEKTKLANKNYILKISFTKERKLKTFSDKQKLKEFVTSRLKC